MWASPAPALQGWPPAQAEGDRARPQPSKRAVAMPSTVCGPLDFQQLPGQELPAATGAHAAPPSPQWCSLPRELLQRCFRHLAAQTSSSSTSNGPQPGLLLREAGSLLAALSLCRHWREAAKDEVRIRGRGARGWGCLPGTG